MCVSPFDFLAAGSGFVSVFLRETECVRACVYWLVPCACFPLSVCPLYVQYDCVGVFPRQETEKSA